MESGYDEGQLQRRKIIQAMKQMTLQHTVEQISLQETSQFEFRIQLTFPVFVIICVSLLLIYATQLQTNYWIQVSKSLETFYGCKYWCCAFRPYTQLQNFNLVSNIEKPKFGGDDDMHLIKNFAYARHRISQPMQLVAPIFLFPLR